MENQFRGKRIFAPGVGGSNGSYTPQSSGVPQDYTSLEVTGKNHSKQIIGYITQYDGWKDIPGVVPKFGYNQLNVDYTKYTILNFSFFGVAVDGSLHSGDFRNKEIYKPEVNQAPAPLIHDDGYSSLDMHLLYGNLDPVWYIGEHTEAYKSGYRDAGNNQYRTPEGTVKSYPLWFPKNGGAQGLLKLCKQHGVKCMAAVGGWSMSKHFPSVASDPEKRNRFVSDCKKLIDMGFDGIDIDWEFPGATGMNFTGTDQDFRNFTILMRELRNMLGPDKLLTAAFSALVQKLEKFEWSELAKIMDYFNMMTYDMNGGWSEIAGHNSPLYDYSGSEYASLSLDATTTWMLKQNIPADKINLGVAFYGRGVITEGPASLNAPTLKRSEHLDPDGPVTTSADIAGWKDFLGTPFYSFIEKESGKQSSWKEYWDEEAKVPYRTLGNRFLSYDNERSVAEKAQYIVNNNLAGVIIWTVFGDMMNMTDRVEAVSPYLVRSPEVKTPLLTAIDEVFRGDTSKIPDDTDKTPARAPEIGIISPASASIFNESEPITFKVAFDEKSKGNIARVEYYGNKEKLAEITRAPFDFTWKNVKAGVYSVTAVAITNQGTKGTSKSIIIEVADQEKILPLVELLSPSEQEKYTAGSMISLHAKVGKSSVKIDKVEFWDNGKMLTSLPKEPYRTEVKLDAGKHMIVAKAVSQHGYSESNVVQISVEAPDQQLPDTGRQLPQVELLLPADGAEITLPTPVEIEAKAVAHEGNIVKVEFFNGATKVGEASKSPYKCTWNANAAGRFSLTAVAMDSNGGTATSVPVMITVKRTGGCDVPAWEEKAYEAGSMVSRFGKVYRAKWYAESYEPPLENIPAEEWTTPWEIVGPCGENLPPTVFITMPADGAVFKGNPAFIELKADATDGDSEVAKVEFYDGNGLIHTATKPPFTFKWSSFRAGKRKLMAKAVDSRGAIGVSPQVNITIESASNTPPVINIITPETGQIFTAPATVLIEVELQANEGKITEVACYSGNQQIGTAKSSPYKFTWQNAPVGTHSIRVVAMNGADQVATAQALIKVVKETNTENTGDNPIVDLITPGEWDVFFPYRYPMDKSFYSYENFVKAIRHMDTIELIIERNCGREYLEYGRHTRVDKVSGQRQVLHVGDAFDPTSTTEKIVTETVNYAAFLREGSLEERKRELAAFLANISQETTGGTPGKPDRFQWGLYFREEQGYEGHPNLVGYAIPSKVYPPAPGKSYHGRGPIQLSYNYNYGPVSAILYGDKNVLLNEPELVVKDGALAFQTAIWFWMTPQYPKPSCHNVIVPGKWTPTPAQVKANIKPGFGATVNIINGGVECGGPQEIDKVRNRIGFYQRYAELKGVSLELDGGNNPENCGCKGMKQFMQDPEECKNITFLSFHSPEPVVTVTALAPLNFSIESNDPRGEIQETYIEVDGKRIQGSTWTPGSYGSFTAKVIGIRSGKPPITGSITFTVWNRNTGEGCSALPKWNPKKTYQNKGNIVLHNGAIYVNSYWAGADNIPGVDGAWEQLGLCKG